MHAEVIGLSGPMLPSCKERIVLAKNRGHFSLARPAGSARCARASDVKSGFALLGSNPMLPSWKERIVLAKNRGHFCARCAGASDPKVDLHFWDRIRCSLLGKSASFWR